MLSVYQVVQLEQAAAYPELVKEFDKLLVEPAKRRYLAVLRRTADPAKLELAARGYEGAKLRVENLLASEVPRGLSIVEHLQILLAREQRSQEEDNYRADLVGDDSQWSCRWLRAEQSARARATYPPGYNHRQYDGYRGDQHGDY